MIETVITVDGLPLPASPIERLKSLMRNFGNFLESKGLQHLAQLTGYIDMNDEKSILSDLCERTSDSVLNEIAISWNTKTDKLKQGYQIIDRSVGGRLADLNKNSGGRNMFLCVKSGNDENPITGVAVFFEGKEEEPPFGFRKIGTTLENNSANINYGNGAFEIYLSYRKGNGCPVEKIGVVFPQDKESVPDGYHTVSRTPNGRTADLNSGSEGREVFLCLKFNTSKILRQLLKVYDLAKPEKKIHVGALAIITSCLYSPDENIVGETLELLRNIEVKAMSPLPRQGLNYILQVLCDLQPTLMNCMDRKLQIMNLTLIRDLFNVRILDIQPETALHIFRNSFFSRHDDKKDMILLGFITFCTSLRSEIAGQKILEKKRKASENVLLDQTISEAQTTASSTLNGLIDFIHFCRVNENLLHSFQRHRNASDLFIKDSAELLRAFFKDPMEKTVAALMLICSKFMGKDVH